MSSAEHIYDYTGSTFSGEVNLAHLDNTVLVNSRFKDINLEAGNFQMNQTISFVSDIIDSSGLRLENVLCNRTIFEDIPNIYFMFRVTTSQYANFSPMGISDQIDFDNKVIDTCSFKGANLKGCSFENSTIRVVDFTDAILEEASFTDAQFFGTEINMDNVRLFNTVFSQTFLENRSSILNPPDFERMIFEGDINGTKGDISNVFTGLDVIKNITFRPSKAQLQTYRDQVANGEDTKEILEIKHLNFRECGLIDNIEFGIAEENQAGFLCRLTDVNFGTPGEDVSKIATVAESKNESGKQVLYFNDTVGFSDGFAHSSRIK